MFADFLHAWCGFVLSRERNLNGGLNKACEDKLYLMRRSLKAFIIICKRGRYLGQFLEHSFGFRRLKDKDVKRASSVPNISFTTFPKLYLLFEFFETCKITYSQIYLRSRFHCVKFLDISCRLRCISYTAFTKTL